MSASSDEASVLFANDQFYTAFTMQDMDGMSDVWSDDAPISCIHPGWGPLMGRDAVLESWRDILTGGHSPKINYVRPHVDLYGDMAVVTCFERMQTQQLCATNIFIRSGAVWRMVHHQAGPVPPHEDVQDDESREAPKLN